MRTLNNPRYAGAYVYGRRQYRRAGDGKKTIQRKREYSDWLACIPNAHPGYISWEQFQENLKILETNGRGYERGARVAAARRSGATARTRRLRSMRKALPRPICRAARKAGSLVCLRSWAHGSRRAELPVDRGAPIDEAIGALVTERDDACGRRTGPGNQTRDRGSIRRGRSATLPRDGARPDRSGSRTAPIHAGRSEQPSRCRHPGDGNGTTNYGRWPRHERNESGRDSGTSSSSTMRSASGWPP